MSTAGRVPILEEGREVVLPLRGLEVDSLLAFLALLGLLRALEAARPQWRPRASWVGPPWLVRLHTSEEVNERLIAEAACDGIDAIAERYRFGEKKDVKFTRADFREYLRNLRGHPIDAALGVALAAELPEKKSGGVQPGPLVLMFGQGHQHFLDRLRAVPSGELPNRLKKAKPPPKLRDPRYVHDALFLPWRRDDDADAFRWDPEEDQRYALRFGKPSAAGAAPTVHGANRLAALGFLSFSCAPARDRMRAVAVTRDDDGVRLVWPVWKQALSLGGIEALLAHPDVLRGELERVRPLGVQEIFSAKRVANGKFMNVTRAMPVNGTDATTR
jgi:hypothetical protein